MTCHRLTVDSFFNETLTIQYLTFIGRELRKIWTSFVYQIKFHLGMTPPRANKQEKEEICEKDLYLSILKEL